jgi:hypothetical protein
LPGAVDTAVGAVGTFEAPIVIGVIAADIRPAPFVFLAATLNVYCTLLVKFVIVWDSLVEENE